MLQFSYQCFSTSLNCRLLSQSQWPNTSPESCQPRVYVWKFTRLWINNRWDPLSSRIRVRNSSGHMCALRQPQAGNLILVPNVNVTEVLSSLQIAWSLWPLLPVKPEVPPHLKLVQAKNMILSANVRFLEGLSLRQNAWPLWPLLPVKQITPT